MNSNDMFISARLESKQTTDAIMATRARKQLGTLGVADGFVR
jgi:hypothetical protein